MKTAGRPLAAQARAYSVAPPRSWHPGISGDQHLHAPGVIAVLRQATFDTSNRHGCSRGKNLNRPLPPSVVTRVLHLGLAAGVCMQLLLATFMQRPRPGLARPSIAAGGFDVHLFSGMFLLPWVLAWFLWLAIRRREKGPGALYPWFTPVRRRDLLTAGLGAFAALRSRCMPTAVDSEPVARTIHGLGALCTLLMALTGTLVWLGMSTNGQLTGYSKGALLVHRASGTLMWVYVVGHVAMALIHHWQGDDTLRRMFRFPLPGRRHH